MRGSNFVMKIDERTLPTGYRLTTPNPGSVVLTRGKMAKLNFGASIHRVVRIDVTADAFEAGSTTLRPQWSGAMEQVYPTLSEERSVLRIGYGRNGTEDSALAQSRVRSLQEAMRSTWRQIGGTYPLLIETEVYQAAAAK
jgi:large repetitive protein